MEERIKVIMEWVNKPHAYLSESTEYARGYKAGIAQAKYIVRQIIANADK